MVNFPFFRFPYNNYYYRYYPNYIRMNYLNKNENIKDIYEQYNDIETKTNNQQYSRFYEDDSKKKSSSYNNFGPIHFANPFSLTSLDEPALEILGIQLYLDDIIILGLLFFLYKEGVKDEMLFLSLILLLLT